MGSYCAFFLTDVTKCFSRRRTFGWQMEICDLAHHGRPWGVLQLLTSTSLAKTKKLLGCHLTGPQQMERLAEPIDMVSCGTLDEETNCRLTEHAIFTIPPGVSHFNVCQDAMHILYCGGAFSHAMGNALKYWCYHSNCMGKKEAWKRRYLWFKSLGIENRLSCLKATMFVNTERHQEKPFFKIKAGERKSLVHVFAQLAIDFNMGDETSAAILAVQFTDLLGSCSRHCTDLECAQAEEILLTFMANYKFCSFTGPQISCGTLFQSFTPVSI